MATTNHLGLALKMNQHKIADIYLLPDGNLAFCYGAEAVGQHARERLMAYKNEWFLDTEVGMPWLDDIMAQRYNPALAEALVKNEIINTDGVTAIVSFSVRFDLPMRRLNIVEVQASTEYEQVVRI